jgi:exo-beta-1,3-glucanase (GH17 family)
MRTMLLMVLVPLAIVAPRTAGADAPPDARFPLFAYLTGHPAASLVAYTPSELDPRQEINQKRLATSSIRADLEALRPAFDGLVLYGYNEACTPRIVAVARQLKFRAVLLAVWDPKSAAELDGVAELARLYDKELALGVLVGNEGITFSRYEIEDLAIAADRLRRRLPATVPLSTSEPLPAYSRTPLIEFGDFLAPNIHPIFDRRQLGPGDAARWVRDEAGRLAVRAGKPVLVKETGLPHAGKEFFTPQAQFAFWSSYLEPGRLNRAEGRSEDWSFHGVAFEAFDLPWKSEESGLIIEKSWGLLSPARRPYPAFQVWRSTPAR